MELKPVIPFEPVVGERMPAGPNWIAQVKWDGVRMLAYSDGRETRLWNRRRNERTMQYPEFTDIRTYCSASSVILDGELIALEGGSPSFHEIMKRDRLRDIGKIKQAISRVPVTFMIFDVLYCDNAWVTGKPLSERQRLLDQIVIPGDRVQTVRNVADAEALLEVMRSHGMEGIVCKDLTKPYALDGKDDRWMKFKLFKDVYAVVGGVTFRGNIVNALLVGLYDEHGSLYYIGHVGTGKLSQEEWARLTERVKPLRIADRPFRNIPERNKDAVWIRPELAVRVQFLNWTPDGVMRHPSIQSFVEQAHALQLCTFRQNE